MKNSVGDKFWPLTSVVFPGVALFARILIAKFGLLIESTVKNIANLSSSEEKELVGRDDWSICTLSERESVSSRYVKYRFIL